MKQSEYFAIGADKRRGEDGYVMSQSDLKQFAKDPWSWINGREKEETNEMRYGSAVDVLYLTPGEFQDQYVIVPKVYPAPTKKDPGQTKPWNMKATYCKDWFVNQKAAGKVPIYTKDLMAAKQAVSVLERHEIASYLREGCRSQTVCQWEWTDHITGITVPLKCMIDLEPLDGADYLADFKTSVEAGISGFRRNAARFRYDLQGAFYLWGYAETTRSVSQYALIVSESTKPYPVAVYNLTPGDLAVGRAGSKGRWGSVMGYQQMLALYCRCLASGIFPQLNDGQIKPLDLYRE